jgi:ethanolamine utilization microcompartment shell protein EutL
MKRIDDAGEGVNTMDVPFRFIPCLVAGLAYYLALKLPNAMERLGVLKQQYDEAWQMAADEDREKASVRFVPRQMFIN